MLPDKEKSPSTEKQNTSKENTDKSVDQENVLAAHEQAQDDIDHDPEFSAHNPNDDLDEGESARLGEDNNPIV